MISDDRAEKAVEWIRDNSTAIAQARAEMIYLEEFRKSKRAMLIQEVKGTIQERESFAYSHKDYLEVLDGLKAAVGKYEELKWRMVAAEATIEAWRTQSSTARLEMRAVR